MLHNPYVITKWCFSSDSTVNTKSENTNKRRLRNLWTFFVSQSIGHREALRSLVFQLAATFPLLFVGTTFKCFSPGLCWPCFLLWFYCEYSSKAIAGCHPGRVFFFCLFFFYCPTDDPIFFSFFCNTDMEYGHIGSSKSWGYLDLGPCLLLEQCWARGRYTQKPNSP